MTAADYFAHLGPSVNSFLGIYCLVLYFICTSFARLADMLHDHDMAHHEAPHGGGHHHHRGEIVVHALELHVLTMLPWLWRFTAKRC